MLELSVKIISKLSDSPLIVLAQQAKKLQIIGSNQLVQIIAISWNYIFIKWYLNFVKKFM